MAGTANALWRATSGIAEGETSALPTSRFKGEVHSPLLGEAPHPGRHNAANRRPLSLPRLDEIRRCSVAFFCLFAAQAFGVEAEAGGLRLGAAAGDENDVFAEAEGSDTLI